MGFQPYLASRSEVVSIYKSLKKLAGHSQQFGAQEHQILDHYFRDFRTRHRISSERNVASKYKMILSIYNVFPKS